MSGEREAVEARARAEKFLFDRHRQKYEHGKECLACSGIVPPNPTTKDMADFSLAENAELRKDVTRLETLTDQLEQIIIKKDKAYIEEIKLADANEKRAEAAEAEVVKLRGGLETIRTEAHKGAVSMSLDANEFHELEVLAESALNPGAAKEGDIAAKR